MLESIKAIYTTNLGVRRTERVLVFTDTIGRIEVPDSREQCRRERLRDVALLTAEVGKSYARTVTFHEYPSTLSHAAEPPEEVWCLAFGEKTVDALKSARLLMPLLTKTISDDDLKKTEQLIHKHRRTAVTAVIAMANYSTSHTRFRDLLTRVCGARYASMPLFAAPMLNGAMNVDWRRLERRTTAIARMVNRAESVEIKTANGSHITLSKRGRKAMADTGVLTRAGSFGNLPAGEVYLAPVEGSAQGRLVLEWAPTHELSSPVTVTVGDGSAVCVAGEDRYADVLEAKFAERSENRNIAELGIGTNHKAQRPDNILESEKILGTIHIAFGDNSSFGGTVKTPFHQDFVFFKPTVVLIDKDGVRTVLMRHGKFIPKIP